MDVNAATAVQLDDDALPDSEENDGGIRIGDIYIPPPPLPVCTFDPTGPRLIISHIENINFKSYAGRKKLGPIHKNFTAVIGPNGSGKSNVIDAMLFVFGYRAQKIRSKKVGVLIHNSDEHPDLKSCTVIVHFQKIKDTDDDKWEPVPGTEFTISRTAFKDNSSYYEINNKRVQFKRVGALLRSHGIDLDHNRFLILQGEIEMIAMMKPRGTEHDVGMLEYLEDIIGCNRFIEPIDKFSKKVEELTDIRTEKLNRVKLIEKEKDDLEAVKNEAIEYIKLENKVVLLENKMYQLRKVNKEQDVEVAKQEKDATKEEIVKLETEEGELHCARILKEKQHTEIQMAYEKCKATVEEADQAYSELERKDVVCRDNLEIAKEKLQKLSKSLKAEETKLNDLLKIPTVREGEQAELEKKLSIVEGKKENEEKKLKVVMESTKKETGALQEEKDKYETELIDLRKVVNETKTEMNLVQSQLDMYVRVEKKEQAKLEDLEKKLTEVTASTTELKKSIHEAETTVPNAEKHLQELKNERQEIGIKETRHSEELRTMRAKLEESRSALNSSRSRSIITEFLMEQQRLGRVSGVLGRLGDLGGIEAKYDIAISTACGPLDNIITETMETAQTCVEYLKKHNKGYCTFIALDKIRKWEAYAKQENVAQSPFPERVPRLFDLVKVKDARILPAFYFALRDTLVSDDLEQATRIGLHGTKRYRVVTLKGEVIDLAGTMTGGGGRVSKGRMGKSVCVDITPGDVEKLQKNVDNASSITAELRERRINLDKEISTSEKNLNAIKHQLVKQTNEYSALSQRETLLSKQIIEQRPIVLAAAPDKAKVNELTSQLEKATKRYEKANEAAGEVDKKVEKLHKEITTITKEKFGAVQKAVDKLSKEIGTIRSNINTCANAIKTARRNQKKAETKIQSLTEEIEEVKTNHVHLKEEYKELTEKAEVVLGEKTKSQSELEQLLKQKQSVMKEINETKSQEQELKRKQIDLKNKLKQQEAKLKEKQDDIKRIQAHLTKLHLQKVDENDADDLTLPVLTPEELEQISENAISYEIGAIEAQMNKMKPNISAIADYKRKEDLYKKKVQELDEITREKDEMKGHYDNLRKQRLDEFMTGFKIITFKLKEVYQMITLGGDAELELVDSLDPFAEGIIFSVRPPKKSWKNITNLSGGEKTLSSLALVFALHYYKPTPFYVMDEIDAALDFKNVSIVAHYIKDRTKNAQFIVISLRNNMFELADRLVGIYKTHNCTKSVTVFPDDVLRKIREDLEQRMHTMKAASADADTQAAAAAAIEIAVEAASAATAEPAVVCSSDTSSQNGCVPSPHSAPHQAITSSPQLSTQEQNLRLSPIPADSPKSVDEPYCER